MASYKKIIQNSPTPIKIGKSFGPLLLPIVENSEVLSN